MNNNNFIGRGWKFPPEFDIDKGSNYMVCDKESIEQSIKSILSTTTGERLMNIDFGCNLNDFMFSNIDTTTSTLLRDEIKQAIENNEPRVEIADIHIENSESFNEIIKVYIEYIIVNQKFKNSMVFEFECFNTTDNFKQNQGL